MWQKDEKAPETKGVNWDKFELIARQIRYPFILITIGIFIATNLKAFQDNQARMWLFFVSGIIWMLSAAFIDVRDKARFANRLRSETSGERPLNHRRLGRNKIVK